MSNLLASQRKPAADDDVMAGNQASPAARSLVARRYGAAVQRKEDRPGRVSTDGNDFTGHVEIPRDSRKHTQQYSELGLPLTVEAWVMQGRIDGGKLAEIYDRTLLSSLHAGGVLARLVDGGTIRPDRIPEDFAALTPDELAALIAAIKRELGDGRAFLDSLTAAEREEFQQQVIRAYMARARDDEDAAFMLELMPTDTTGTFGQLAESAGDAVLRGQAPNDFKVGDTVGKIRESAVVMSEHLQAGGDSVYALPVPYANTVPNIVGRTGVPSDGADHLHNYLAELGPDTKTVTTGYSQGGAAVLDYVKRYGDADGLDYALALAPMGGADTRGADGVHAGDWNGVTTLSIMNARDPAKDIQGKNLFALLGPMLTFISAGRQRRRGLDGDLHSGFFGDEARPLAAGDEAAGVGAGTLGYPTAYMEPMLDDLFGGRYSQIPFERRGDWAFDLRQELRESGIDLDGEFDASRFDPESVRQIGREVADRYLPR